MESRQQFTIKQQFILNQVSDPFTLLKISQAFRAMHCGEALEFLLDGSRPPEELFKVLPRDSYQVVGEGVDRASGRMRIVLTKKKEVPPVVDSGDRKRNCSCE